MKNRLLFLVLFSFTVWQIAFAYDFKVDGICYTVLSFDNNTVAVDGLESMSGIVDIPSHVVFNNKTFTVTSIYSARSNRISTVKIPSTVINIERGAFAGSSIEEIEIPDNVTNMGSYVFSDCVNLKKAYISQNISSLYDRTFQGCTNLISFEWHPLKGGSIWGLAFADCESIKTIRIPPGVTFIGDLVGGTYNNYTIFDNCHSLDSLIFEDGKGTIRLPYSDDGDKWHGEFYGCNNLGYVYLGRAYENKYKYSNQTPNLSHVRHLVIGDSVEYLPSWFGNLRKLEIGKSLTAVTDFSNNSTLEYIKVKGNIPPKADGFSNYNYINTILYVPKGLKSVYESADKWKNFWNIQEYDYDGGDIEIKKCANPTISVIDGKLSFSCETEDVEYHYAISNNSPASGVGNDVAFSQKYTISVYASKRGYENSDTAIAEVTATVGLNGDANGDRVIDVADIVKVTNIIMGK